MGTIESVINQKIKRIKDDVRVISENSLAPLMNMEMRRAILDTIYSVPEGNYYDRTFGVLNSITTSILKKDNDILVSVFNEPSLMVSPHESWVTNEDMRENIHKFLARGHRGIVHYTPSNYDILTYQRLLSEKKYLKIIKNDLKKKGYIVK